MKVYLANGLFSESDRLYNQLLAEKIRSNFPDVELYVPQENMSINDKTKIATSQDIAKADVEMLKKCDLVVAVLDGVEVDAGVSCEVGIAYALDIPVLGLLTDIRFNMDSMEEKVEMMYSKDVFENPTMYRNLFLTGIIRENGRICRDKRQLIHDMLYYDRLSKNILPF